MEISISNRNTITEHYENLLNVKRDHMVVRDFDFTTCDFRSLRFVSTRSSRFHLTFSFLVGAKPVSTQNTFIRVQRSLPDSSFVEEKRVGKKKKGNGVKLEYAFFPPLFYSHYSNGHGCFVITTQETH